MKPDGQIFEKYLKTEFRENPSGGSRVFTRADMTKLIVVLRNFAKAPKIAK